MVAFLRACASLPSVAWLASVLFCVRSPVHVAMVAVVVIAHQGRIAAPHFRSPRSRPHQVLVG
jgi:hypothetical protein